VLNYAIVNLDVGIVKLGDFGIAKVLDASDDYAKTQIGTPYYLSPEICESRPYGRSSDVWSLGVVLFEILALELPFQAQSLPALVTKICMMEPNYEKISGSFCPQLVDMNKSMLNKNCDARPDVRELVKSEFMIKHISRLLSYTIRIGKGGAEGAAAASEAGSHGTDALDSPHDDVRTDMDAEEAERNIEIERKRQRDQEIQGKEAQVEIFLCYFVNRSIISVSILLL
jgi:NIMA (never in mitosis gene a)-related kinase